MIDSPHLMPAYAAALFACALVPGMVLSAPRGAPCRLLWRGG